MSRDPTAFAPTRRFSRRADDYLRYRPRYPRAAFERIVEITGLTPQQAVADLGSGTGFSAEMFLRYGCTVYGVEPNAEMRAAGEGYLAGYDRFVSIDGSAEATTLPDHSVDLVVAGQAFHWFDVARTRNEIARILRPDGWVALLWNTRSNRTAFMIEYDALVERYSGEVRAVQHSNVTPAEMAEVFRDGSCLTTLFDYAQEFDADGIVGRTLSSSYMPDASHADAAPMIAELRALFDRFDQNGRVLYHYTTELYLGRAPLPAALPAPLPAAGLRSAQPADPTARADAPPVPADSLSPASPAPAAGALDPAEPADLAGLPAPLPKDDSL